MLEISGQGKEVFLCWLDREEHESRKARLHWSRRVWIKRVCVV